MDKVIKKISEIEATASSVMDDANKRKQAFAKEMEEKTAEFDRNLDAQTEKKINELEIEMNSKLSKQKSDAAAFLAQMQTNYDNHHRTYVQKLFEQLVKE